MFSENVIDASRSQFCLLMSVNRDGLRRNNCIRLIGLAVLSGGTVYPGKKSHKRKDSKLRVLQLRKYLSNEIISRSNKQTKQNKQPTPKTQHEKTPKCSLTTHSRIVFAFPVVTFSLWLTTCLFCPTIAAVVVKAAPERNRNGDLRSRSLGGVYQ